MITRERLISFMATNVVWKLLLEQAEVVAAQLTNQIATKLRQGDPKNECSYLQGRFDGLNQLGTILNTITASAPNATRTPKPTPDPVVDTVEAPPSE